MFGRRDQSTTLRSAMGVLEVTYHATVRNVQKMHGNAIYALMLSIMQTMVMVAVFYLMFAVLGLRSIAVRGDFILYLLSGIFLFVAHSRTIVQVMGAEAATSGMMKHSPMNSAIAILAAAFGALYIQILSVSLVLLVYHSAVAPITIEDPAGAFLCFFLSWAYGVAVGTVFYALKPWAPMPVQMVSMFYRRANMIASGKMFLANSLPGYMLMMFDWNPLFHLIDQARGYTFINYNPHFTNLTYPVVVMLVILTIGMMWEFYTKRHSSLSWDARR